MTRPTCHDAAPAADGRTGVDEPRRWRVLFDCPAAHAMFDDRSAAGIGGAEFRAATFARGLAAVGPWDVHFVLASREPRDSERREGVLVHYEAGPGHARTWLGTLGRAMTRLVGSLEQRCLGWPARRSSFPGGESDVVAAFGVSNRTASVVRTARARGQAVVLFITSDRTLEDVLRRGRRDRGLYGEFGALCRYSLRNAHAIIAQTEYQSAELRRVAGVHSVVIRNPIESCATDEATRPGETRGAYVLWVGRSDNNSKRADLALEVARRCPKQRFVLIMNRHDERLFDEYCRDCPGNVTIVPHVPWRRMDHYYRHADWLMNTSDREGLPNAFLQSGLHGVPVVSLNADPDGLLARQGGGVCAGGAVDRLVETLQRISVQSHEYQRMSRRIREQVLLAHGAEARCRELSSVLLQSLAASSSGPASTRPGVPDRGFPGRDTWPDVAREVQESLPWKPCDAA
jgi:Glycosyl transferases group 1